jgi:uncharacterized protein YjdB
MARPSNPRKESRLFSLPAVRVDNGELAQQAIPMWTSPKGVDRFHSSARVGMEHAVKIRNLMFEDGVLASRRGTDLMGGNAASKVMQVIDFIRQGTKKVTVRFCLRHIEVFEYGSGTWRSFAVPLTGSERDFFAYTGWADKLLFSNGVDGLWEFDFKTYSATLVPGAPGAKHLTTFGNRVVASAVTVGGNFYPLRVKWTAKNDYKKWDVINDLGAGEEDLYGSPGGATDEVMGVWPSTDETAWMVRSRSVWQMSVSGNVAAPFRFSRILAEVGSPFRNTVVSAPAGIIFASRENIHIIDSGGHSTIGEMVIDEILEEVSTLRSAYAAYDVGRSEYRFACDELVWRYRFPEQGWTADEYPFPIRALSRQIQGKVGIPIDSLPGIIDELPSLFPPGAIDDLVYQREDDDSMMFVPVSTELVVRENDSTQDTLLTGEKTDSEMLIESGVVNSTPMEACELHEMHLEYESQMEQELLYEATFDDGANFQPLSGPKQIEETFGSEILFSKVTRVSRKLQIRLRSLTLGKLRILGFAPTIVKVNRIMAPKKPRVSSISALPTPISLVVGGTQQLSITLLGPGGQVITNKIATLLSNNNAIATVSATGLVRAVAPGSFAIVASSGNVQVSISGTVAAASPAAIASVTVTPAISQGATGTTQQFTATVRDASGNILIGRTITWGSSNNAVATAVNGVVSLLTAGTVAISATSEGVTGAATLTVTASAAVVDTVTVAPSSFAGDVGETVQLVASPKDASANVLAGKTITWSSDAPSIATVSATGLVTMVGAGSVTITATCETIEGDSTGTVTAAEVPVATVVVAPSSFSVAAGATQALTVTLKDALNNTLTGRVITYSSTNTSVATVNSSGVVTGVAAGTATIIVTSEGKVGTSGATVTAVPVASVAVSPASFSIGAGATQVLVATPKDASNNPLTGRTVTWGSSDPTVATVSALGVVTGVAAGSATITATCETKAGTSAATIGAATYSPVNQSYVGTYVPEPNPADCDVELPRVFLDYTVPTVFASTVTLVNSGNATQNTNDLQAQIDAAAARSGNSNIRLPLPFPHNTIRVRKHAFAGSKTVVQAVTLPSAVGTVADTSLMTNSPECQVIVNGEFCHNFDAGADNTYFIGLKLTAAAGLSVIYDLIRVEAPNDTILGDIPSGIWYDRCLVRGNDPGTGAAPRNVRNGIRYNGKMGGVVGCVIDQIGLTGTESHAIVSYNTPGPCKFVENRFSATSIGVLIGGARPAAGLVDARPSDYEIRRNHFTRPLSWAVNDGSWDGQASRGIKNQLETKNLVRGFIEGNVIEKNWADGQTGNIVVFKSAVGSSDGVGLGSGSQDITFRHNKIRNSTRYISLHGHSDEQDSFPAKKCLVFNNLAYDIGSYAGQSVAPILWLLTQNFDDLYIAHNTTVANITASSMQFAYPNLSSKSARFVYRDNINEADYYWGDTGVGTAAIAAWAATGYVWERNVTVMDPANWGGSPGGTNQYDNVRTDIGYEDIAGDDYRLDAASPYKGDGLDGADPGADIDKIDLATSGVG